MKYSELSLDELLWIFENIISKFSDDQSIPEEVNLLLDGLIIEIIDRCPFRPFEGQPWTNSDFYFNQVILELYT